MVRSRSNRRANDGRLYQNHNKNRSGMRASLSEQKRQEENEETYEEVSAQTNPASTHSLYRPRSPKSAELKLDARDVDSPSTSEQHNPESDSPLPDHCWVGEYLDEDEDEDTVPIAYDRSARALTYVKELEMKRTFEKPTGHSSSYKSYGGVSDGLQPPLQHGRAMQTVRRASLSPPPPPPLPVKLRNVENQSGTITTNTLESKLFSYLRTHLNVDSAITETADRSVQPVEVYDYGHGSKTQIHGKKVLTESEHPRFKRKSPGCDQSTTHSSKLHTSGPSDNITHARISQNREVHLQGLKHTEVPKDRTGSPLTLRKKPDTVDYFASIIMKEKDDVPPHSRRSSSGSADRIPNQKRSDSYDRADSRKGTNLRQRDDGGQTGSVSKIKYNDYKSRKAKKSDVSESSESTYNIKTVCSDRLANLRPTPPGTKAMKKLEKGSINYIPVHAVAPITQEFPIKVHTSSYRPEEKRQRMELEPDEFAALHATSIKSVSPAPVDTQLKIKPVFKNFQRTQKQLAYPPSLGTKADPNQPGTSAPAIDRFTQNSARRNYNDTRKVLLDAEKASSRFHEENVAEKGNPPNSRIVVRDVHGGDRLAAGASAVDERTERKTNSVHERTSKKYYDRQKNETTRFGQSEATGAFPFLKNTEEEDSVDKYSDISDEEPSFDDLPDRNERSDQKQTGKAGDGQPPASSSDSPVIRPAKFNKKKKNKRNQNLAFKIKRGGIRGGPFRNWRGGKQLGGFMKNRNAKPDSRLSEYKKAAQRGDDRLVEREQPAQSEQRQVTGGANASRQDHQKIKHHTGREDGPFPQRFEGNSNNKRPTRDEPIQKECEIHPMKYLHLAHGEAIEERSRGRHQKRKWSAGKMQIHNISEGQPARTSQLAQVDHGENQLKGQRKKNQWLNRDRTVQERSGSLYQKEMHLAEDEPEEDLLYGPRHRNKGSIGRFEVDQRLQHQFQGRAYRNTHLDDMRDDKYTAQQKNNEVLAGREKDRFEGLHGQGNENERPQSGRNQTSPWRHRSAEYEDHFEVDRHPDQLRKFGSRTREFVESPSSQHRVDASPDRRSRSRDIGQKHQVYWDVEHRKVSRSNDEHVENAFINMHSKYSTQQTRFGNKKADRQDDRFSETSSSHDQTWHESHSREAIQDPPRYSISQRRSHQRDFGETEKIVYRTSKDRERHDWHGPHHRYEEDQIVSSGNEEMERVDWHGIDHDSGGKDKIVYWKRSENLGVRREPHQQTDKVVYWRKDHFGSRSKSRERSEADEDTTWRRQQPPIRHRHSGLHEEPDIGLERHEARESGSSSESVGGISHTPLELKVEIRQEEEKKIEVNMQSPTSMKRHFVDKGNVGNININKPTVQAVAERGSFGPKSPFKPKLKRGPKIPATPRPSEEVRRAESPKDKRIIISNADSSDRPAPVGDICSGNIRGKVSATTKVENRGWWMEEYKSWFRRILHDRLVNDERAKESNLQDPLVFLESVTKGNKRSMAYIPRGEDAKQMLKFIAFNKKSGEHFDTDDQGNDVGQDQTKDAPTTQEEHPPKESNEEKQATLIKPGLDETYKDKSETFAVCKMKPDIPKENLRMTVSSSLAVVENIKMHGSESGACHKSLQVSVDDAEENNTLQKHTVSPVMMVSEQTPPQDSVVDQLNKDNEEEKEEKMKQNTVPRAQRQPDGKNQQPANKRKTSAAQESNNSQSVETKHNTVPRVQRQPDGQNQQSANKRKTSVAQESNNSQSKVNQGNAKKKLVKSWESSIVPPNEVNLSKKTAEKEKLKIPSTEEKRTTSNTKSSSKEASVKSQQKDEGGYVELPAAGRIPPKASAISVSKKPAASGKKLSTPAKNKANTKVATPSKPLLSEKKNQGTTVKSGCASKPAQATKKPLLNKNHGDAKVTSSAKNPVGQKNSASTAKKQARVVKDFDEHPGLQASVIPTKISQMKDLQKKQVPKDHTTPSKKKFTADTRQQELKSAKPQQVNTGDRKLTPNRQSAGQQKCGRDSPKESERSAERRRSSDSRLSSFESTSSLVHEKEPSKACNERITVPPSKPHYHVAQEKMLPVFKRHVENKVNKNLNVLYKFTNYRKLKIVNTANDVLNEFHKESEKVKFSLDQAVYQIWDLFENPTMHMQDETKRRLKRVHLDRPYFSFDAEALLLFQRTVFQLCYEYLEPNVRYHQQVNKHLRYIRLYSEYLFPQFHGESITMIKLWTWSERIYWAISQDKHSERRNRKTFTDNYNGCDSLESSLVDWLKHQVKVPLHEYPEPASCDLVNDVDRQLQKQKDVSTKQMAMTLVIRTWTSRHFHLIEDTFEKKLDNQNQEKHDMSEMEDLVILDEVYSDESDCESDRLDFEVDVSDESSISNVQVIDLF